MVNRKEKRVNKSIVGEKSKAFAIRIIRLYQHVYNEKKEQILSRQILSSGTSIGANIREALQAQSNRDFLSKMSIALKEASETEYWLELLAETGYITTEEYNSIAADCSEHNRLLTSIVRTTKNKA